jgi:hypothetical protein
MKRFLLSMAAGVIALAGLGLFTTAASAHQVRCAPVQYHRAAINRAVHWAHGAREHHVRLEHFRHR